MSKKYELTNETKMLADDTVLHRIHELRSLVKEMADEKRISDAVIKSLRDKKLEMAGEIAAKDEEIARLRALVKAREVVK